MSALAACALALAALAPAGAQDAGSQDRPAPAPAPTPAPVPDEPAATDAAPAPTVRLTSAQIEAALAELAQSELVDLRSIGQSAGGKPLFALALAAPGPVARVDERPAILLADACLDGGVRSGEALVALVRALASAAAADPASFAWLGRCTLYVAPDLDPERRDRIVAAAAAAGDAPGDAARAAPVAARPPRLAERFEVDFPTGWLPPSLAAGAGAFPLSRPESRALASFVAERDNVAAVALVLDYEAHAAALIGGAVSEGTSADATSVLQRAAHDPLAYETEPLFARPWIASAQGHPLDFVRDHLGRFAVAASWTDEPAEPAAGAEALAGWVRTLAAALPRLEYGFPSITRLGAAADGAPALWQVDVRLLDRGRLPVRGLPVGGRPLARGVRLAVRSAELVALAEDPDGDGVYTVVPRDAALRPSAGETRLRLVLAGSAGTTVAIDCEAPRAARATLEVTLP